MILHIYNRFKYYKKKDNNMKKRAGKRYTLLCPKIKFDLKTIFLFFVM